MAQFRYWPDEQREAVAGAACFLLENVGVRLTEREAQALLQTAGARLDGVRAFIPAGLVRQALASAPRSFTVYTRDGRPWMELGRGHAYFGAHTDAPDVLDPRTGRRRPCVQTDVAAHARLVDALPQIHFATASGLVADRPAEIADRVSLAQCLLNTSKPVLAMPVTPAGLADCRALAAAAAGGDDALRQRPVMMVYAEPVSPLVHPDESVRKLLYCADHQIPLVYSGYAAMGGTGPQSPAGIVAQLCAEALSGLVMHQLKRPGAPFIFGGMASVMDMRTTVFSYGAPEFQRGNTLLAEMAHHFRLPNLGTAGTSDAQTFDGQAVLEAASSCLMAALVGADLVHDVGLLGNATVVMPEMTVATGEVIAMIRRLLADVPVDPQALALEVIAAVGPAGEYITQPHTLAHFRETWYPQLLFRGGAKAWEEGDQQAFADRVNARTRTLMAEHRPGPVPPGAAAEIERIMAQAKG